MAKAIPPDTGKELETVRSADGTKIAFERTGSGDPLVLVHGGACDHRFWDLSDIRSTFAEHYTVYAIDCRGVGESDDAPEYELKREFEDVAAVVDSIDSPVRLLGHSSGALLSREAALRTNNLHNLILYEPPIPVGDHELYSEEVLNEMKRLLDAGKNEQVLILFLQEIAQSTPEEIDAQRSAPDWQDLVDAAHVWPHTVARVMDFLNELGKQEVQQKKRRGKKIIVVDPAAADRYGAHHDRCERAEETTPSSNVIAEL